MVESSGLLFATRYLGLHSKVEQQIVKTKSDRFDLCVLQCHKERTEEKAKLSSPSECEPTGTASQEPALSTADWNGSGGRQDRIPFHRFFCLFSSS